MRVLGLIALFASSVAAWGAAGHEIVATIAQIFLTEQTRNQIRLILPPWTKGQLAPIASWPDRIKRFPEWRSWTSPMHYIDPLGDWPSSHCEFGDAGWHMPEKNILTAINNYTRLVEETSGQDQDYALRFLVHYIGDLHQPLHLTGRERGGNGIKVRFEHRLTSLHGVWDVGLVTKAIREMKNYTRPLPDHRIERALRGAIYDPYVRLIVKEGLLDWWKDEYPSWSLCPSEPASLPATVETPSSQKFMTLVTTKPKPISDDPDLPACPLYWATPMHKVNCEIAFPPELNTPDPDKHSWLSRAAMAISSGRLMDLWHYPEYMELDTPEYTGYIQGHKIIEKQLAMGGIRLAAVLNDIFDPPVGGVRSESIW